MKPLGIAIGIVALGTAVQAQPPIEGALPISAEEDDPIGVAPEELVSSREVDPRYGPRPPDARARSGEVLTAIPGVRERSHRVSIEIADGLASIEETMEITNVSPFAAEARYRIPVPERSTLADLEVCVRTHCRLGIADPAAGEFSAYDWAIRARGTGGDPVAHARIADSTLVLRAAPVPHREPLVVRVRYLAPAALYGGVVRLTLPARGNDANIGATEISISAPGLTEPHVNGAAISTEPVFLETFERFEFWARSEEPTQSRLVITPCERERCARVRLSSPWRGGLPRRAFVIVDVSPSVSGPARGRLVPVLRAFLDTLPADSEVDFIAMGATAQTIEAGPAVGDFSEAVLARTIDLRLGAATRLERAWQLLRPRLRGTPREMIVLIGDGTLTASTETDAVLREIVRGSAPLSVVQISDDAAHAGLDAAVKASGGTWIETNDVDGPALRERLAALVAPMEVPAVTLVPGRQRIALGPLRAGEEIVWQGAIGASTPRVIASGTGRPQLEAREDPALATQVLAESGHTPSRAVLVAIDPADLTTPISDTPLECDGRGPAARPSGVSSDDDPVATIDRLWCAPPSPIVTEPPAPSGTPFTTLRDHLRQRVIPPARSCFRQDRRGRLQHSARAVFRFELVDQEVASVRVEGHLDERLRSCLAEIPFRLEVPRFTGRIIVTYPLHTEAAEPPIRIELHPDVAESLDRQFQPERSDP